MRNRSHPAEVGSESGSGKTAPTKSSSEGQAASPPAEAPAVNQLTSEEQWALFEKDQKENDWGHQPC